MDKNPAVIVSFRGVTKLVELRYIADIIDGKEVDPPFRFEGDDYLVRGILRQWLEFVTGEQ